MTYGGMPLAVLEKDEKEKEKYLKELFSKIYIADIKERYNLKDEESLSVLINVLLSSVGSLTNPHKLNNTIESLFHAKLSDHTVKKYMDYFKISVEDVLIISDDLDLDFGKIRLRLSGSSGGHNGLKNIEENLGTKNYKRMKFGISNNKNIDTKDYVLGSLSFDEIKKFNEILPVTIKILDDFMVLSFVNLMNKYN